MRDEHRFQLTADMSASTTEDLAAKLNDLATDLLLNQWSRKSIFGSTSCSGYVEITEAES